MLLSEHLYCVAIALKMTEWVEQWICITFPFKPEHYSMETIWMIQKATTVGNWWLAASSWQPAQSCITSCAALWQITPIRDSAPLQPRFDALWPLVVPHTKITFEREEISDCWWDSGKYERAADGDGENCVRSQGSYFEGDWSIIVLCTMFLISSINVFIFHITLLDTSWTDLVIY